MDLNQIITDLRARRDRLAEVIAQLKSVNGNRVQISSRRGRKSIGEAERREVSVRMKHYWVSRRKAIGAA